MIAHLDTERRRAVIDAAAADVLSGAARIGAAVALPRLLRRDAELRWWGAIHETVGPWVAAGRRVGHDGR